jgi:hypothetical protein
MMVCQHNMNLFLYGLFNDAVSSWGYTQTNGRMINDWRITKYVERTGRDLFQGTISALPGVIEEITKISFWIFSVPAEIRKGTSQKLNRRI